MSIEDRWRGARKGDGKRWQVRWREAGKAHKRNFDTRQAAESFDARRRTSPEQQLAAAGRILTVDTLMTTWLATKGGLKPKTLDAYRTDVREVLMTFHDRLASSLRPTEVRIWAARDRGASLRRRSLVALAQAYRLAVADGLLLANPCDGVNLPNTPREEPRYLSWVQLRALADAAGDYGPMVWLLGTAGLRIGEAVGLQVGDVDRQRGRIRVARSVAVTSQGSLVGAPKSGKGRDVPVAAFVLDMLPVQGRAVGEWLFVGPRGGRIDAHNWRTRVFRPAARAAGLGDLHPHVLRHTAASLAIGAGADVMVVQRMLGHASAAITLSIYSHLFDQGLDTVAGRMDEAGRREPPPPELRIVR